MDTVKTSTTTDHRPQFARVTEEDRTRVEVDITSMADRLIFDIATALHRRNRRVQIMQIGNPSLSMATRLRIRNELVAVLAAEGCFTHEVGDDDVEKIQADLAEAERQPNRCLDCDENYATVGDLCGHCDEVSSFRNALAGGRL